MKRAVGYPCAIGPSWGWILIIASGFPMVYSGSTSGADDEERRIDVILSRLSLEEKLGQLQQLRGDPKSGQPEAGQLELVRHGRIGSFLQVRGARHTNAVQRVAMEESSTKIPILFGFDVIHGYRTIFPAPLGAASSWDPAAVERSARIAAEEASAAGVRWVFAPMVDIARDPRWGRIIEGAGEDPYLGSAMAPGPGRGSPGSRCARHGARSALRQARGRLRRRGKRPQIQRGRRLGAAPPRHLLPAVPGRAGGGSRHLHDGPQYRQRYPGHGQPVH